MTHEHDEEICVDDVVNTLGCEFDALVAYLEKKGVINRVDFEKFCDEYFAKLEKEV